MCPQRWNFCWGLHSAVPAVQSGGLQCPLVYGQGPKCDPLPARAPGNRGPTLWEPTMHPGELQCTLAYDVCGRASGLLLARGASGREPCTLRAYNPTPWPGVRQVPERHFYFWGQRRHHSDMRASINRERLQGVGPKLGPIRGPKNHRGGPKRGPKRGPKLDRNWTETGPKRCGEAGQSLCAFLYVNIEVFASLTNRVKIGVLVRAVELAINM